MSSTRRAPANLDEAKKWVASLFPAKSPDQPQNIEPAEPPKPDYTIPSSLPHQMLKYYTYWEDDDYGPGWEVQGTCLTDDPSNAVLISSRLTTGKHAPILDIDLPMVLVDDETREGRQTFYVDTEMTWRDYKRVVRAFDRADIADFATSIDGYFKNDGPYRLGFAVDAPAQRVASSTPGHFHLYIDAEMQWRTYRGLLRALAKSGLIETRWAQTSIKSGYTTALPPWLKKETR